MTRQYATLFDKNYLAKGLALYRSLVRHSKESFQLHILCMDDETNRIFDELALPNAELIYLPYFERALHLEPVRESRSWQEYCWTCASNIMEYLLPWCDADGVTYLDADLFFFSDPAPIFEEIGQRSIGITPHRFPPAKKHMERNGRFNVGLVYAKNTLAGQACIARWAKQCREWCFLKNVEGRFGDQMYLDTWEADYPGEVCAIENIGVNLAPWNVSRWPVTEGPRVNGVPVICYHFHEFEGAGRLTNYALRECDRQFIYRSYILAETDAQLDIAEVHAKFKMRDTAKREQATSA